MYIIPDFWLRWKDAFIICFIVAKLEINIVFPGNINYKIFLGNQMDKS